MKKRHARHVSRQGMAVVYLAVILTVLVGVVGLGIDTAYVFHTGHQLQNAADAAALAGANIVGFSTTQAKTDAVTVAAANKAAQTSVELNPNTDVILGNFNRTTSTFTAAGTPTNAVKVNASKTANLFFGKMFGVSTSNVSRQAIAISSPLSAGLLVLNKTANPAIQLIGSGNPKMKIDVTGGAVVVDSSSSNAIAWNGNPNIAADSISIVGTESITSIYTGTTKSPSSYVPDPYLTLPAPAKPAAASLPNPGYYPSGISVGGNSNTVLTGGTYYIDGGISMSGGASITCTAGCLIYLHTGGINMGGNNTMTLSPMTSGTWKGITFYGDRSNTSAISLQGGPGVSSTGVFYFPSAAVSIAGNPDSASSQLICDTLTVQGSAQLNIKFDSKYAIPRHQSFLVK